MDPERNHEIQVLFLSALEQDRGDRSSFLEAACPHDQSLRLEVESLLASHDQAEGFMETPAMTIAAQYLASGKQSLAMGQSVGHYELIGLLGTGGMGDVYLAEDTKLGRKVALKLLPQAYTNDQDRLRRFEQEARAASSLSHPNVCVIHEVGECQAVGHFIVMEYVDGLTLRQRMADTRMRPDEVLDVGVQIASALAEAHQAGIVHRDVKPENVILRRDGLVKVLDFGLAKLTGQQAALMNGEVPTNRQMDTTPGLLMGTVKYMSPEQARGLEVDARSDIFSFGVVLFEMTAGHAPFEGETTSDLIAAILKEEPPLLAEHAPNALAGLQRIINRALHKGKEGRYQAVDEMLFDLKRVKQELELEVKVERSRSVELTEGRTPAGSCTPSSLNLRLNLILLSRTLNRHKGAVSAALAALVVAVGALAYLSSQKNSKTSISSIAVLPLISANSDLQTEYLADGISDGIIFSLSKLLDLKVISRNSVYPYKGRKIDAQAVGHELAVQTVLIGNVVQRGEGISVSVELVNVQDNTVIWGEQYNHALSDLVLLQEDISRQVSEGLRLKLTAEAQKELTKRYTNDSEAYKLYLKGRYFWNKRTEEGFSESIKCFSQAIEADPEYSLAYAGLADSYLLLAVYGIRSPKDVNPRAKAAAMKALEIDETLANAHTALASIRWGYEHDAPGAEREFKRAIQLNPNYATGYQWYGLFLATLGRQDEAISELNRAEVLDPLSLSIKMNVGWVSYFARNYDQAIERYQETLKLNPNFGPSQWRLALAFEQKGMYERAIEEFERAIKVAPDDTHALALLGHAYAVSGKRKKAVQILDNLEKLSSQKYISSYSLATIYAGLGDQEQALRQLEKTYEDRDEWITYLQVEPVFGNLHSDPRFSNLLRRVGLSP